MRRGALYFEVGLDAEISLKLSVDLLIKTVSKKWTLWSDRWPLYTKSWSSTLSLMDIDKLDVQWALASENASNKTMFGFSSVPMQTYSLMTGKCVENELLLDSVQSGSTSLALCITNLVIDGETIAAEDPRNALLTVGDGSAGAVEGLRLPR